MSNRFTRAMTTRDGVRRQLAPLPALPPMNEKAWLRQVVDLAEFRGWKHWHTQWSVNSAPGWPDLPMCRPPRFLVAELKTDRATSRTTPAQDETLELLRACPGVEVYVWRPSDFDQVREVLW